ncbi:hypothetical protein [Aestuariibacter sp. A3R04]|uniref:hypothetical protein n=1 Tax=Aestuariibacter sp. A3R04 TaxID=2841571 RepID=UPI001C09DAC1|nr:hypothetical protein [Aestuariibacter sp. A3R04]MBU3022617.1 hypothetical protein [Aestuariibacter sp. A3R04]
MNLEEIQAMWQVHSEKLDQCINLNKTLLAEKKIERQRGELNKLILVSGIEGFIFFSIIACLGSYMASSWALTAPVVSAFILNIFAIVGLAGSIGQIVLLSKIDFAKPVKETLTALIAVRTHNLNTFKLIMLSAPFYMAYVFIGYDIVIGVDLLSLMPIEIKVMFCIFALVFAGLVALLIVKLKPENRDNKIISWLYKEVAGHRLTHLLDEFENLETSER